MAALIETIEWRHNRWRNRVHTGILMALMALFLVILGSSIWGVEGGLLLMLTGGLAAIYSPTANPEWVMGMYGARRLQPAEAPNLYELSRQLAQRAGLPHEPRLYYLPTSLVNAFAVGRRHEAVIGLTDGLLRTLNMRELAGVLAHEVSHIRNNDLWVLGLADWFSQSTRIVSMVGLVLTMLNLPLTLYSDLSFSWFTLLLLLFAPSLSAIAQMALSRTREYDADLNAAWLTEDPDGLASALLKLEGLRGGWLERVLMPGRRVPDPSLLRSHPDTDDRVDRLLRLKSLFTRWRHQLPLYHDAVSTDLSHPGPRWRINGLWY